MRISVYTATHWQRPGYHLMMIVELPYGRVLLFNEDGSAEEDNVESDDFKEVNGWDTYTI